MAPEFRKMFSIRTPHVPDKPGACGLRLKDSGKKIPPPATLPLGGQNATHNSPNTMRTKILKIAAAAASISAAIPAFAIQYAGVEIDASNIGQYKGEQTADWIGGNVWAVDFGNSYGPHTDLSNTPGDSYFVATSTLNAADVKKITSGGSGFANSLIIVDEDFDANVYYSTGGYGGASPSVDFSDGKLSYSGFVTDFVFSAENGGSCHTVSSSVQDINLQGTAVLLDFSSIYSPGSTISGNGTLFDGSQKGLSGYDNVSYFYTLDGTSYHSADSPENGISIEISASGDKISCTYAIPEPSACAAAFGAFAAAMALLRIKNRKRL